jgi:DNA-dependent RNA polymerase auxiliary subunit epsilon
MRFKVFYKDTENFIKSRNVTGFFNIVKDLLVEYEREKTDFYHIVIEEDWDTVQFLFDFDDTR